MSDVESVIPAKKPAPSIERPKTFRKRNRGRVSTANRTDAFRTKQNAKLMSDPNALTKGRTAMDAKYLTLGLDLPDLAPKAVPVPQAAAVPISLRGVGVSAAMSYGKAVSLAPAKVLGLCTIHQAFRACLLQAWLKLHRAQESVPYSTLGMPEHVDFHMPDDLRSLVSDYPLTLSLMSNMLGGIGWSQVGTDNYRTYVPVHVGLDAFGIHPLNLRLTLDLFQNADGDAAMVFRQSCTIPGIVYDDNGFIANVDEVVPVGWPNRALCRQDLDAYSGLLTFLKGKYGLVSEVSYEPKAVPLALIRREITAPEDSGAVVQHGNSFEFTIGHSEQWFSRAMLDGQTWSRGVLSLLGDLPPVPDVSVSAATFSVVTDWSDLATTVLRPRS